MNTHWSGGTAGDCQALDAIDAERHLGEIAPITREKLRLGSALMRSAPAVADLGNTAPVREFRWAAGSGRAAEVYLMGIVEPFSARQNVAAVLSARSQPSPSGLAAARAALARLKSREGEDVDAWAEHLAEDLSRAGE